MVPAGSAESFAIAQRLGCPFGIGNFEEDGIALYFAIGKPPQKRTAMDPSHLPVAAIHPIFQIEQGEASLDRLS